MRARTHDDEFVAAGEKIHADIERDRRALRAGIGPARQDGEFRVG
jgi:hypothetical protein